MHEQKIRELIQLRRFFIVLTAILILASILSGRFAFSPSTQTVLPVESPEIAVSSEATEPLPPQEPFPQGKQTHPTLPPEEGLIAVAANPIAFFLFWFSAIAFVLSAAASLAISGSIRRRQSWAVKYRKPDAVPGIGTVHNIGKRKYQQDALGTAEVLGGRGILAVLADGMGGLADSEQVSRRIVSRALGFGSALTESHLANAMPELVDTVNEDINRMLGKDGLYQSGSTLVAVLIADGELRWASVGDSRIYLCRDGRCKSLTRDHDLLEEWMPDIQSGKRSYAEAAADPNARKLTSFIGMGELRYKDWNRIPIPLIPGDRVILMSDGVYGALSNAEISEILRKWPDVQQAVSHLEQKILRKNLPQQDNFTAILLEI